MTLSRRTLDLIEPRLPALARALATPAVRGTTVRSADRGLVWRSESSARALVVYLTGSPALSRWLAGSIALRVPALVLVPDETTEGGSMGLSIAAARADATAAGELAPDAPTAIVGEAEAARLALMASRAGASRLALLYPAGLDAIETIDVDAGPGASVVPTTLIQAAASGPARGSVLRLDRALRRSGTAVRETEYDAVDDGWARYPRVTAGSRRALDDLIAFLDRGIGEASTFDVIPGWELH